MITKGLEREREREREWQCEIQRKRVKEWKKSENEGEAQRPIHGIVTMYMVTVTVQTACLSYFKCILDVHVLHIFQSKPLLIASSDIFKE